MTDTTLLAEIAKAIPVIAGGLLAIAGGFGSQVLIHRLTEARERASRRRGRLEALVRSLYRYEQWLEEKQVKMVFRNEDHDTPSPLDEARMIQALHFPELANELLAVQRAQISVLRFFNEQRLKHMTDRSAFIEQWNPEPFYQAYPELMGAIGAVVVKCRSLLNSND